jgi:ribosomal-protein-alanine N-acetyltransferase
MKFPTDFSIETLHFKLRYPSLDDIPAIFKAAQVPGFTDGMQWSPPSSEDELIAPYEQNVNAWAEDRAYCFSITRKDDGEFLGRISIRKQEDAQQGIWDLGFYIVPEHQGNNYMTEVVRAVLAFGFDKLDAQKVEASYALWNIASERVLQKNGMTDESNHSKTDKENGFMKNDEWVATKTLSITRVEWTELNATTLE